MKNLKKAAAIILAVAMVLSLVSVNVFAAPDTNVYYMLEATAVENGQFTLNVYVADDPSGEIKNPDGFYLATTQLELTFDSNVISIVDSSSRRNSYYNGTDTTVAGLVKMATANVSGTEFVGKATPAAVFTCTVLDSNAESVTFTPQNFMASDENVDFVPADQVHAEPLTVTLKSAPPTTPPTSAPTSAPTAAPTATVAPATSAPTATAAPATSAPTATVVPATAAPPNPPVDTKFTLSIPKDSVPPSVRKLVVKGGPNGDIEIERASADEDFPAVEFDKGYTYNIAEAYDEAGEAVSIDEVNSDSSFSDSTDVIDIKEGETKISGTFKDGEPTVEVAADEEPVIGEFTIVTDGQDVVYNDDTKNDFKFKKVDDHKIRVIYKDGIIEGYINVKRTIKNFSVTIDAPKGGSVLKDAEIAVPGHYTISTAWYIVDGETQIPVAANSNAEYSTNYKAVITISFVHELDAAAEDAVYMVNNEVQQPVDGTLTFERSTNGKPSIGTSTFGTGGGAAPTAVPSGTSEPVVTPPASEGKQVFDDVPPTYWAYDYIMDLYNAGIVNGETATMFMPENNITRAEFTKIAVNVFELKATSTTSQFSDVKASDWFATYVIAATEAGLVNGISENEFAPNADITREQMATIIGRQMNMTSSAAMAYSDAASISDYAKEYVAGLTENGLLQGDETGNFRPQANAARSEASALLDRVYVLTRSEEVPEDVPETTEAPTAAPAANNNSGFSTGTTATAAPTEAPAATEDPAASEAPEASSTPASK